MRPAIVAAGILSAMVFGTAITLQALGPNPSFSCGTLAPGAECRGSAFMRSQTVTQGFSSANRNWRVAASVFAYTGELRVQVLHTAGGSATKACEVLLGTHVGGPTGNSITQSCAPSSANFAGDPSAATTWSLRVDARPGLAGDAAGPIGDWTVTVTPEA
ncbi:MAG: hypothetical protein ACT4PT_10945 [Methanobacteriota archaeon]